MKVRSISLIILLAVFTVAAHVPAAQAAAADPPFSLTFQSDEVGKPPQGWVCKSGDPARIYSVCAEDGKKFVRASSDGAAVPLGYEKPWPLKDYPILQWQWRALLFPEKSDERDKTAADSVLGVYVVFGRWPFIRSIKYVWSDSIPEGETFESPYSSRTKIVVVRSGRERAGVWVTERRDVLADYMRVFGESKPPVARGIAIMTDADNTRSRATGDYTDIRILER